MRSERVEAETIDNAEYHCSLAGYFSLGFALLNPTYVSTIYQSLLHGSRVVLPNVSTTVVRSMTKLPQCIYLYKRSASYPLCE